MTAKTNDSELFLRSQTCEENGCAKEKKKYRKQSPARSYQGMKLCNKNHCFFQVAQNCENEIPTKYNLKMKKKKTVSHIIGKF